MSTTATPTILRIPDFDATDLAESLHEAMKGAGTDDSTLIEVLGGYDNEQIQEIRQIYKASYGTDLIEKIESETSGNYRTTCVALLRDRVHYMAHLLHDALAGAGTKIQQLVDVMACIDSDVLEKVKQKYKEVFESDLEQDVMDDTSGNHEKTLIAILAGGRPADDGVIDEGKAMAEAQELYEKGEGKLGTDNAYFRSIFCTRSWEQLGATLQAYDKQRDGQDIRSALKSEFSGNALKLYLAMASYALDRASHFANILKECVEGVGTSDDRLIYTIVLRCEIDLSEVKRAYMTLFSDTLAAAVAGDTSGDYEKILLALINGNV